MGHFRLEKACNKVREFCRRETVLCIGAVLTLLSMATVPPGPGYASYIDLRVLLPLTIGSLKGLMAASLLGRSGSEWIRVNFQKREKLSSPRKLAVYTVLFALYLLSVFRILHYGILAAMVVAVLLFTSPGLLMGVNIGGLETPIASLASLISLKLYLRTDGARPARYLAIFTLANLVGLALLLGLAVLLPGV